MVWVFVYSSSSVRRQGKGFTYFQGVEGGPHPPCSFLSVSAPWSHTAHGKVLVVAGNSAAEGSQCVSPPYARPKHQIQ